VPLNFSPLRLRDPMEEVSVVRSLLDSVGAKMLKLEEIIGGQLEAEGRVLAEAMAEHMLMCFQSWDPQASLEPMVQGPVMKDEEAARADVQDTAKLVAAWFEHQPKDS
jgi:hypothetical protein